MIVVNGVIKIPSRSFVKKPLDALVGERSSSLSWRLHWTCLHQDNCGASRDVYHFSDHLLIAWVSVQPQFQIKYSVFTRSMIRFRVTTFITLHRYFSFPLLATYFLRCHMWHYPWLNERHSLLFLLFSLSFHSKSFRKGWQLIFKYFMLVLTTISKVHLPLGFQEIVVFNPRLRSTRRSASKLSSGVTYGSIPIHCWVMIAL